MPKPGKTKEKRGCVDGGGKEKIWEGKSTSPERRRKSVGQDGEEMEGWGEITEDTRVCLPVNNGRANKA